MIIAVIARLIPLLLFLVLSLVVAPAVVQASGPHESDGAVLKAELSERARCSFLCSSGDTVSACPILIAQAADTPADTSKSKRTIWTCLLLHEHDKFHPPLIHFPIAFLVLEAALVLIVCLKPHPFVCRAARYLLIVTVASFFPAVVAGLHDAGDGANFLAKVASGFLDRVQHFGDLHDTLSLHVLFVTAAAIIAILRLVWQRVAKEKVFAGAQRFVFAGVTVIGLWLLLAAAQLGGEL